MVNGHLGDALAAVGRLREAEFQWRRALTLKPEPADARETHLACAQTVLHRDVVIEDRGVDAHARERGPLALVREEMQRLSAADLTGPGAKHVFDNAEPPRAGA